MRFSLLSLVAACLVLVLVSGDASAFGRRNRCSGGSCGTRFTAGRPAPTRGAFVACPAARGAFAAAPVVTGCGSCPSGACPTACASGSCSNGVCVPKSFPAFVPSSVPQAMPFGNCPNGKCPLK